jgi:hypothetical protein
LVIARSLCSAGNPVAKIINGTEEDLRIKPTQGVWADILRVEDVAINSPLKREKAKVCRLADCQSEDLSEVQREELEAVVGAFADVFAVDDSELGVTPYEEHRIETGDHMPIKQAARRKSPNVVKEREMVEEMLSEGIVVPSNSPWCANTVLVRKKDGSARFCVDYRALNTITVKDAFPLPRIDDTLDALSGAVYFSTLDMRSGYWQVKLRDEDRARPAFAAGGNLYEFTIMPFGVTRGVATFSRIMKYAMVGLTWVGCLVFLDDVIVFGKTWGEHLNRLALALSRIREANLKLKPSKKNLQIKFLGHIVSCKASPLIQI